MTMLHTSLKGAANVYTLDYRGNRRSTLLECESVPSDILGGVIEASDLSACFQELQLKYGDLASFSTTSAATDISTFISKYTNGASTIVYGMSYGTIVVQRVMHLNPPYVTGYVLDGVATTSVAPADNLYISSSDAGSGDAGNRFLDLCDQDSACNSHFQGTNLTATLHNTILKLDSNPNSTCATLMNSTQEEPSMDLRLALGGLLHDSSVRSLIPPLIYRINRCNSNDIDVLTYFNQRLGETTDEDPADQSMWLYSLIAFSEMWETPAPSCTELKRRFTDVSSSNGATYSLCPLYCAFSNDKSPGCDEFRLDKYDANGVLYSHDQYCDKVAAVPDKASVLLMSGKLDTQTHFRHAEALFEALDTSRKEHILFDYADHGAIYSTPYEESEVTCGIDLLASYVSNNGDLEHLDKSCTKKLPAFSMALAPEATTFYFSTDEPYDGMFIPYWTDDSVELDRKRHHSCTRARS